MESERENRTQELIIDQDEAYKVLRTNIEFLQVEGKLATFTLTSCLPGEGKSTTAYNLAVSLVQSGLRVLLVDADLRKPMQLKSPGIKNLKGLTNYIMNRATLDEIIIETSIPGLCLVSCGVTPPNPVELLDSTRFHEFLDEVAHQYDAVLFDTPPLGVVIDAAIVAAQTEATILVVRSKQVDYKLAQSIKEQLDKANAKILGVVLNRIDLGRPQTFYHYYKKK